MRPVSGVVNLCNVVQTTSLEDPYGVCGQQSLSYYDPSTLYSAARCDMECETKKFVDECHCKDVYMPGSGIDSSTNWGRSVIQVILG